MEHQQTTRPGQILLRLLPIIIIILILASSLISPLTHKGWKNIPGESPGFLRLDPQDRVWSWNENYFITNTTCDGISLVKDNHWVTYTKENSGITDDCVEAVSFDEQGGIWIGSKTAITHFDGQTENLLAQGNTLPPNDFISSKDNHIDVITIDPAGKIWVGTWDGWSIFDGTAWENYSLTDYGFDYSSASVNQIVFDKQGKAWIAATFGIIVTDGDQTDTHFMTQYSGNHQIALDDQEHIWVSFCNGGSSLIMIDDSIQSEYNPGECISGFEFDQQGRVWVNFRGGGISVFDGKTWATIIESSSRPSGYFALDKQNRAWIYGYGNEEGLDITDQISWKHYTTLNSGLSFNEIRQVEFDPQGRAWIYSSRGDVDIATLSEFAQIPSYLISPITNVIRWLLPVLLSIVWFALHPLSNAIRTWLIKPIASWKQRFALGALVGGFATFLTAATIQMSTIIHYRAYDSLFSVFSIYLVVIALIASLIFGVLGGGFGGLILGSILRKRLGAILGALVILLLSFPILLLLGTCYFMGGC